MQEGKSNLELEKNLEDTIGVSFRAFRTIRDLFVQPNTVFRAYEEGDTAKYTPTLKIWFMLTSVYFTCVYFLGGVNNVLISEAGQNVDSFAIQLGLKPEDADAFTMFYEEAFVLMYMPVVMLLMLLIIPVLKRFNRELSTVARVNVGFALLIPNLAIGTLLLAPMHYLSIDVLWVGLVFYSVYFITFLRGTKHWFTKGYVSRLLNSLVLCIVLAVLETASGVLVGLLSAIATGIKFSHLI
jgi:hypothetical protein